MSGNQRWPRPGSGGQHGQRPQSPAPFRGPPPPPGWASPIPRMTQSPPPFLIRPIGQGRPPPPGAGSPLPRSPFSPPLQRWSQGTPPPMQQGQGPRPFFRPISPMSPVPLMSPPQRMGPPPPPQIFSPDLRPSFDMEFVYPVGMDPDAVARAHAMSIPQESVDEGPSTAQIIAQQSQDYVDEKLAEYQATIQHLQDEQERVQKKTFVNWINSYLAKHVPPLHIVDLIDDLKDGTRLLALLQVLSGEKLPVERHRNARRPHFLSNCNTALEFLQRKKIKLVNINSSDVVDGRPAVVLGLVWTIILYFQLRCRDQKVIEENTRVLASLGYRLGAPTPTPGGRPESASPKVPIQGRMTPTDKWKDGARKALLAWVKEVTHKRFGVVVNDFANSWRDGNAFLAICNSIRPGIVDMERLRSATNRTRLETAFRVAETELGIPRLLDPEDVDVPRPDEKSIMTYVAQFLHKSNEPKLHDSFSSVQALYDELVTWLMQKTQYMEHMKQTGALPMSYSEFQIISSEFQAKHEPYHRLKTLVESHSQVGITDESWAHLQSLWRKLDSQLKEWEWRLDASLPDPFGSIGQWLAKAELLVTSDDVPAVMDDEAARILNAKIESHKAFFLQLPDIVSQFSAGLDTPVSNQVPSEQLQSMATRLNAIGPKAQKRAVKLKFLEHKCCLVAFIMLVENRLKQWTVKYGREEHIKSLLDQYNNFVNRNKIFQEFERAYIDMQNVIEEYKREGGIDQREGRIADHFLWEIGERWKSVSMELRCLQSMLEEVIAHWRRWEQLAPDVNDWIDRSLPMVNLPEEERIDYFQDLALWADKFRLLSDSVSFLGATCDPAVMEEVKTHFTLLQAKWESLFHHVRQYLSAGQVMRMKKDFLHTLSGLQQWLRAAEDLLASPQPTSLEAAKELQGGLAKVMTEIDGMDEIWRTLSKKFQSLLPELSGDEVDRLMKTVKNEKEALMKVRAQVPLRQGQINQMLTQQESLEAGQQEIAEWLQAAEGLMSNHSLTGGPGMVQQLLDRHRQFFARSVYYRTMLESKNKIVGGIVRSGERGPTIEHMVKNMQLLTDHFKRVEQAANAWEQKLGESIRCWRNYEENKQTVMDWMGTAEKLLQERNLESKTTVEAHKNYFEQINDRPLRHMSQAAKDLQQFAGPEEIDSINKTVAQLHGKWMKIMAVAPIHLARLEFRLEEDNLASNLKEMDREITAEHQLLNRQEEPALVLSRHIAFFDKGKVSSDSRACLEKLSSMASRYTVAHPEDLSLKDQLAQAQAAAVTINERVRNLRELLEEIPVQWNAYKQKYNEVVLWMDSVDTALKNILVECEDVIQFESEKAKFLEICREVDRRREDMKQLVQMLDSLVSRRADDEALQEQDLLEQLITRYKNLVPTIELTMMKTDVCSRCYTYREETQRVVQALGNVDSLAASEPHPSSLEEVEALISQHADVLKQLESQRTTVVSLLQKGKDLQKDQYSAAFIPVQVALLDRTWNDTYKHTNERLKDLKGLRKVWVEYRSQRDDIMQLLEQAESELKKLVPLTHDPRQVAIELRLKQDTSVALREATENMLRRLRELAESLGQVSSPERAGVLEEEVSEIEERLRSMLSLLDDKVAKLGKKSAEWGALSEKMDDMKNWMKGAQKTLQLLMTSDLSPEERLRKTKELQAEIGQRMGLLQALEKDAQALLKAEVHGGELEIVPEQNIIVLQQVDNMKTELVNLHDSVQAQKAHTSEAVKAYEECKAELGQVTPWLEQAEVKISMGWPKPTLLSDVKQITQQLLTFSKEAEAQHAKILDAKKKAEKAGTIADEMSLALTKWTAVQSNVQANKEKADLLYNNWNKHDANFNNFHHWLSKTEKALQRPLDRKNMTIPQLEQALTELKAVNKEISDHQPLLISITQECDQVIQGVSPEGAATLNANLAQLKNRLLAMSNEVWGKLNYLSDSIIARQEYDTKSQDFSKWLSDFSKSQEQMEVQEDKLDQALAKIHTAIQEHNDHLSAFSELSEDSKIYNSGLQGTPFDELGSRLAQKKDLTSQWIQVHGWATEATSAIEHCAKQLSTPVLKRNKIHEIEQALDLIGEKGEEWLPKARKLDAACSAISFSVLDKTKNLPLSAELLVTEIKNRLQRVQKNAHDTAQESEKIGSQMETLKTKGGDLKKYFADLRGELSKLKPEKCDLPAVEQVKDKLQHLVEKHAAMESPKSAILSLGNDLIRSDPTTSTELSPIMKSALEDYDTLQGEMATKWENVVELTDLLKKYGDGKDVVYTVLSEVQKLSTPALSTIPTDSSQAQSLLETLKKAAGILSKKKISVDNCSSLNSQLVTAFTEMGVNTSPLTAEISEITNKYETLAKKLAEHIPKLETEALLLRGIEEGKDDLGKWLQDTKMSLQETQSGLGNADLAKMRLGQYKDEVGEKCNLKLNLVSKMGQLKKMGFSNSPQMESLASQMEQGFKELEGLSKDLEKSLGSFEDKEQAVKIALMSNTEALLKLKDAISKCEDRTGSPADLIQRISALQRAKVDCEHLKPQIESTEAKITELKTNYPSWNGNFAVNDLKTQTKRLGICVNQIGVVNTALIAVLEKQFLEKYSGVAKIVHGLIEKIKWCDPSSVSDTYALESKKASLQEVKHGIEESHEKIPGMQSAFSNLRDIPLPEYTPKLEAHGDTLNKILNDLMIVEKNYKHIQQNFDSLAELWGTFDRDADQISAWLKDYENIVRSESLAQISLPELPSKLKELSNLLKEVKSCEDKLKKLEDTSGKILQLSPDSRTGQAHARLVSRVSAVGKFFTGLNDKLRNLEETKGKFDTLYKNTNAYIDNATKELAAVGKTEGVPHEKLLEKVQKIMDDKEGLNLVNKTLEVAEGIIACVTPDSKEVLRKDLRDLRDKWEAHLDAGNALAKKLESLQVQWSSYEENINQVDNWLKDLSTTTDKSLDDLFSTLTEKKTALQSRRMIFQDIESHSNIISSLQGKLSEFPGSAPRLSKFSSELNTLKARVQNAVKQSESHVQSHEQFDFVVDTFADWLKRLESEVAVAESLNSKEIDTILDSLQQIQLQHPNGAAQLSKCEQQLSIILPQTKGEGHLLLNTSVSDLSKRYQSLQDKCKSCKDLLEKEHNKVAEFDKQAESLLSFLKQAEFQVKDPSFKSTVEAKSSHLSKLEGIQGEMSKLSPQFESLVKLSQDLGPELQSKAVELNSRFQALAPSLQDSISRMKTHLSAHSAFNIGLGDFLKWIEEKKKEAKELTSVKGDISELQERKQKITSLIDQRNSKAPEIETLMEQGDKLYAQTSPDGREIIRQQLRTMRDGWESLGELLQSSLQKLDASLSQISDFTQSQEELAKWLQGIETSVQMHTQLKATLEEKRAQLQNHKIVHQEILSHQVLVEAVCDKASQLVEVTQDSSLQNYITSIRQLYGDIKNKSKEILDRLEKFVADHTKFHGLMRDYSDWRLGYKDKLSAVEDLTGEKVEIVRRIDEVETLKREATAGGSLLERVEEIAGAVCMSSSENGGKAIETEVSACRDASEKFAEDLTTASQRLQNMLQNWQNFEIGLQNYTKWFREQEAVLRSQVLQNSLEEKEATLSSFSKQRDTVIGFEKEVTGFLDQSHALLQTSSAERIKPLVMQISNRYQLLHVLSKEVVNKWQGVVDDHKAFSEKFTEASELLEKFEHSHAALVDEPDLEQRVSRISSLGQEKELLSLKIGLLVQMGEKLFTDTGAPGREKIRQDLRSLRDRFDETDAKISDLQKKQSSESQQWNSYQDNLASTLAWLTGMEAAAAGATPPNWLSVPDTKSKLMKLKALLQDAIAHRRLVEGVIEKAEALISTKDPAQAENLKSQIDDINTRYEALLNKMLTQITGMEENLDLVQNWGDISKKAQDFLKNFWEQLNLCTDYTGGKAALQSRLARVQELQASLGEGDSLLRTLDATLSSLSEKIPAAAKETLSRDLTNTRFDFEKLRNGAEEVLHTLQERLQQWGDYEDGLDRLLLWLAEAENTLKGYSLANTLEEKESQKQKYEDFTKIVESRGRMVQDFSHLAGSVQQNFLRTLQDNEASFDKIYVESSELVQATGEPRITSNIQQITSRFQSIQTTAKEILKKCEQNVIDHKNYQTKFDKFRKTLSGLEEQALTLKSPEGSGAQIESRMAEIKSLASTRGTHIATLNAITEDGEGLYPSTASEGREIIRKELQSLTTAFDAFYDSLSALERDLGSKLSKWSGFEESKAALLAWLSETEKAFPKDLQLHSTLDEKRAQLQQYRTLLQSVLSHQQDVLDLQDKGTSLSEGVEGAVQLAKALGDRHSSLLGKARDYVEQYEGIVCLHQQYVKAVQDMQEWVDGTNATVIMWSDESQEKVNLHANLEKLRNLQLSFPEEEYRIEDIRKVAEKVIPGTIESGQGNIRAQVDNSQQEWEGLQSAVNSAIDSLNQKLHLWADFEGQKDNFMTWLRDTDTKLHSVDLQPNLDKKIGQLETLKSMQGEIKSKELELDVISEMSLNLQRQAISSKTGTSASDLGIKYQNVSHKIKELTQNWQSYVNSHQDFEQHLDVCECWLSEIRDKLAFCSDLSAYSPKDLETKLDTLQDLLMYKDEGYAKVQALVEEAQGILANTATTGHEKINEALNKIQDDWSTLAARMVDTKNQLDESIHKWAGFLEQIHQLKKTVEYLNSVYKDVTPFLSTLPEKKSQLDTIRNLEEKTVCERLEVENLKVKAAEMVASGQQSHAAGQAQEVLKSFDIVSDQIRKLLYDREAQFRDHKVYFESLEEINGWLQRIKEKMPSFNQRSLGDRLIDVESAGAMLTSLMNKKPQGVLLIERLQQSGEVAIASSSDAGRAGIKSEIQTATESFESLFSDILKQKQGLDSTMLRLRDWREELERLSDWLQQCEILIKAAKTTLCGSLEDKKKQVSDCRDVVKRLEDGSTQMQKFQDAAKSLLSSHLESYVRAQLSQLQQKYQMQLNVGNDVLKKVEANLEQHENFMSNYNKSIEWMGKAREILSECGGHSVSSEARKERLQANLKKIQDLVSRQEEGQNLVHNTVSFGEKSLRNTRSDGRDRINEQMKEVQTEWDRLVKKMASTKVALETAMLQWDDYNTAKAQVTQWISDREAKLQQVAEAKPASRSGRKRHPTPGMSSASIGDRKATLRATNTIVQDIVSLEPMIESVTSKAANVMEEPAADISTKYNNLTKQAQELFAKQKEIVDQHQAFVDVASDFMNWMRAARERLAKIAEPVGDKDVLSNKITQLKVLQSEMQEGQGKLDAALLKGSQACGIVDGEDREIIEEEVALLQEEFDTFSESLAKCQQSLEVGLVRWKEWEDHHRDAEDWLRKTEEEVKAFNKLHTSLSEKKTALEQFQLQLQSIFDWQKELDKLNLKAQLLLETCADSRVSNAVTHLSTKFSALLSLAKEVIRRLELHYQEHQQHSALYQECQDWIDRTREKLSHISDLNYNLSDVQSRLHSAKGLKQTLEQGQNKLRYAVELKEKVMLATEPSGAAKINEDTELLKSEFDRLLADIQETRQKLATRASLLEELEKAEKIIGDWLQEIELKISVSEGNQYVDLGEKRSSLEKLRGIEKEVLASDILQRFEHKLAEDENLPKDCYNGTFVRYEFIKSTLEGHIKRLEGIVREHEDYWKQYQETSEFLRKLRVEFQQFCESSNAHKDKVEQKLGTLGRLSSLLQEAEEKVKATSEMGKLAMNSTSQDGKDGIKHECNQLQCELDELQAMLKEEQKSLKRCLEAWNDFEKALESTKLLLSGCDVKLKSEPMEIEKATPEDLERCKKLLTEVTALKVPLEEVSDRCETLVDFGAGPEVKDSTVQLQTQYSQILAGVQGALVRVQKSLADHTDFLKEKEELESWLTRAEGSVQDCVGFGTEADTRDKFETINLVSSRLTEGSHLLSALQEAFARVVGLIPPEQQASLRDQVAVLQSRWDKLNMDLKNTMSDLKNSLQTWEDYKENCRKFQKWCDNMEESLRERPTHKAELGDMKTLLERYKNLGSDIASKKVELDALESEADQLVMWSGSESVKAPVTAYKERLKGFEISLKEAHGSVEADITEFSSYQTALQDTEKWLLQTSFQLMAHNSLYITNREQTLEQVALHEALLEEILVYQEETLDVVKGKGRSLGNKYPQIQPVIEKQLKNVQDSYDSLLHTGKQIQKRLLESLAKFQEYEDTLESIMQNLDEWEPEIDTTLENPIETSEDSSNRLEYIRTTHNRLQGEKNRLSLAVQACEAATATLSRPASPQEAILQPIPDKELAVRGRLEDLIDKQTLTHSESTDTERVALIKIDQICDKIQTHMSALSSASVELDSLRNAKDLILKWAEESGKKLKEIQSRPAKLRADTAQIELNQLQDIRTGVGDHLLQLLELEVQESGLVTTKYLPNLESQLQSLDSEVGRILDSRTGVQSQIESYRDLLSSFGSWLDEVTKGLEPLEKGGGLTLSQKMEMVLKVSRDLTEGSPRLEDVKDAANSVMLALSNVDAQLVEEQVKGAERRFGEVKKRIGRKEQILETTLKNYQNFEADTDKVKEEINQRLKDTEIRHGFQMGTEMDKQLGLVKSALKDVESKQTILDTLDRRLTSLQPELEEGEIISAENCLSQVVKLHAEACETLRKRLREIQEELGSKRKFLDKLERAKSWIMKMEGECLHQEDSIPLPSSEVSKKVELLKRSLASVKDFGDGPLAEIHREADSLQSESTSAQKAELERILSSLDTSKLKLSSEMDSLLSKLRSALGKREEFELSFTKCTTWIAEAETALQSDLKGSTSITVLEELATKYLDLHEEGVRLAPEVSILAEKASSLLPTLKEPERHILTEKVAALSSKMSSITALIKEKLIQIRAQIKEFRALIDVLEEAQKFTRSVREKMSELAKPVGSAIEDSQGVLGEYETLLDSLKSYRSKLDGYNISTSMQRVELQNIMKDQDDLISQIESQIQRLRHLLLLQQQYLSLTTEISNFISRYSDIVADVERGPGSPDEKIKRYTDIMTKIQECEAQLASAVDKGSRIAEDGTVADRNSITEQLQSLKLQLHNLRRTVEQKRADHELQYAEFKKQLADLDSVIDSLHKMEGVIKERPLLSRPASSVDKELQKHEELCEKVKSDLRSVECIEETLKEMETPPFTLNEKLGEARLLLKTLPMELQERKKYLEENKEVRKQFEDAVQGVNHWVDEAKKRLREEGTGGLEIENVISMLSSHKGFFGNEQGILGQVTTVKSLVDKMWPTLLPEEQEGLRKEQENLVEKIKNTFNSAKNHEARLEECGKLWKNYLDLLEIVKTVLEKAEQPDEPATTLAQIKANLSNVQNINSSLLSQQQELDNLNDRAKSVEKEADLPSRQRIKCQVEKLNAKWMEALADLDQRKNRIAKIVTQWEQCEILWNTFETGLSSIEEQFSQIDPSIRSQTQLLDTKEAISSILENATSLEKTHDDLLICAKVILDHLQGTSEICYSTLKSKLEHLSLQYKTILKLLQEKLEWLNNQGTFLAEVDKKIANLQKRTEELDESVQELDPFESDVSVVNHKIEELFTQVSSTQKAITEFGDKVKEKFSTLKQVLPTSIAKAVSSLEVDIERIAANLQEKRDLVKRASNTRSDFFSDLDAVKAWLGSADERLQARTQEPQHVKEVLQQLQAQMPPIIDRFERAQKAGALLIQKSYKPEEKEEVKRALTETEALLQEVKGIIDERRMKVAESLDAWHRFLQLHAQVVAWCDEKQGLLKDNLVLNSISDTRQQATVYDMASKTLKTVNKQLSDMGKEIDKVAETSSAAPLTEKFEAVEKRKIELEALLLERNALLQETAEEWEQCERKLREAQNWLEKGKQALEAPAGKRKPLRDQLTVRDKVLADIAVQRTKITLAVEKLQIHFKAGLSGNPNIFKEGAEMQQNLNAFETEVKAQCTSLEASVGEVDKLQEELQQLRNELTTAEQQLRSAISRPEAEQKSLRERVKTVLGKISSRTERIKLLLTHGQ